MTTKYPVKQSASVTQELRNQDLPEFLDYIKVLPDAELQSLGTDLVKDFEIVENVRGAVLKRIAGVVVELRKRFRTDDGEIDWRGRTWEYRQAVIEMYRAAGIPSGSQSHLQGSLRYHVGNALRDAASPAELEAAGLKLESPRERQQVTREDEKAKRVVLEAIEARTKAISATAVDQRAKRWDDFFNALDVSADRLEDLPMPDLNVRDATSYLEKLRSVIESVEHVQERIVHKIQLETIESTGQVFKPTVTVRTPTSLGDAPTDIVDAQLPGFSGAVGGVMTQIFNDVNVTALANGITEDEDDVQGELLPD